MKLIQSGIYTITAPSGNFYVGSSVDIPARWSIHRRQLMAGSHHNASLTRAFTKYGLDRLSFSILLLCSPTDLLMFEQRAIDVLNPLYNSCKIAGNTLGIKFSEEARLRLSAIRKGKPKPPRTPEHIANNGAAQKGKKRRPHTEEHKLMISNLLTGRKHSLEARKNGYPD